MFERLHFVAFSPVTQCLWQFGLIGFSSGGVQTGQGKGSPDPRPPPASPWNSWSLDLDSVGSNHIMWVRVRSITVTSKIELGSVWICMNLHLKKNQNESKWIKMNQNDRVCKPTGAPFLAHPHVHQNESLEKITSHQVLSQTEASDQMIYHLSTCASYVNCLRSLKSTCSTWTLKEISSVFKDSSYAFKLKIGQLDVQWLSRRCHFRPKYQTSVAKTTVCGLLRGLFWFRTTAGTVQHAKPSSFQSLVFESPVFLLSRTGRNIWLPNLCA